MSTARSSPADAENASKWGTAQTGRRFQGIGRCLRPRELLPEPSSQSTHLRWTGPEECAAAPPPAGHLDLYESQKLAPSVSGI